MLWVVDIVVHGLSLSHISASGMERMCIHPKYTQANMINKKKPNTAAKIITANAVITKTSKFIIE
jgi:hypothetical protein